MSTENTVEVQQDPVNNWVHIFKNYSWGYTHLQLTRDEAREIRALLMALDLS